MQDICPLKAENTVKLFTMDEVVAAKKQDVFKFKAELQVRFGFQTTE
jgi:hypothetical protein